MFIWHIPYGIYHNYGIYHMAGKCGGHYIWQTGCFGVLAILNLAIHQPHMMFCNGCTLGLTDGCEHLLELQLTSVNEIKVLKGKYLWRTACTAIIFTSKLGHHLLERNWHTCKIENNVGCGTPLYCCWTCQGYTCISCMCPVLSHMFLILSARVVNIFHHSLSNLHYITWYVYHTVNYWRF